LSGSQIVHIIEDDTDARQALTFALQAAGHSVQMHRSAVAFLDCKPRAEGGCIVTDIVMPGMNGLELQRKLLADQDHTPVIFVTAHCDLALTHAALKAGAVDFLEKPFDNEILLEAIRVALGRQRGEYERGERFGEVRRRLEELSERERQVLDGLVAGKLNKTIGDDLGLSVGTVEGLRTSLMAKMQADTLSALVRMVLADPSAS